MKTRVATSKLSTMSVSAPAGVKCLALVVFAASTLLMPLLYLSINYFIVAAVAVSLCVIAISRYRQAGAYARVRAIISRHPGLIIFIAALITRLLWVAVVSPHTKQVSDFLGVYEDSLRNVPSVSGHSPIWTHYITYPYILHFFVNIFGDSTLVGGVFNAITCSVSILLTYLVGTAVVGKKAGLVASVLMMLWPGMAVYTSIYAPDHLSICFTLLGIFCFVRLIEATATKAKVLYAVACAASLWAMGFFKDLTPVLVVAFVVTAAVLAIKHGRLKDSLVNIYCVLGLCIVAGLGSVTHVPIISAIAGQPVNPSLVPYFIYTGLGGNNTGSWQPEIMDHYTQLIVQDNYDYKLANHTMLHEALSSVKHRLPELPATIWNKSRDVQADDAAKISWVEQSAESASSLGLRDTLQAIVEPANGVFFAGIIMLMCAGVYYAWKERKAWGLMLLIIVCIGYSLLLLIIEAQNRYRYIVEPLYCILAAYGLLGLYNSYASRKKTAR